MMKRITIVSIVIFSLLFFSGCGTAGIELDTKINKNGSIDLTLKTETPNNLLDLSNQYPELVSEILKIEDKKPKIKTYKKDDKNVKEVVYHFKNYKELNSTFADMQKDNLKFETVKHKGFLFNTYDYTVCIQNSLTVENISDKVTSKIRDTGIPIDGIKIRTINEYIANSIILSNKVTIPGKITKSDGTITGSTVTWESPLGEIKENNKMEATFKIINPMGVIIMVAFVIVSVVGVIIFFHLHKKKRKDKIL